MGQKRAGRFLSSELIERAGSRVLIRVEDVIRTELELPPVRVVRPADLLSLEFSFRNLELRDGASGGPPVLARRTQQQPALLIVEFPSQHITELAFFEGSKGLPSAATRKGDPDKGRLNDDGVDPPPVRSLIGGPSRLVFGVGDQEIPYTVEGLLGACSLLDLRVTNAARPRTTPPPAVLAWWLLEVAVSQALFTQPKLKTTKGRIASDLVNAHRLLRTTGVLTHRFGPHEAAEALATNPKASLFGRVRKDLLDRDPAVKLQRLPSPGDPGPERTGIELPWRLIVSPHSRAAFAHSPGEVEHEGRVELWHSRLGLRAEGPAGERLVDERSVYERTMRAIWTRDFEWFQLPTPENLPMVDGSEDQPAFRMALNANDRISIVHLTADWTLETTTGATTTAPFEPEAVDVQRMMLSALGGWLDSHAGFVVRPKGVSVEEWRHRAAMGRDFEVRVVRAGFLFPFGHRASLVKVTERKFHPDMPGTPAYLFQRMFIVVRQPRRSYGDKELLHDDPDPDPDIHARNGERIDLQFPFKSVTLTTRVTPFLDEPKHLITGSTPLEQDLKGDWVFFPYVDHVPFLFKAVAVDLEDRTVEFGVPLLFVGAAHHDSDNAVDRIRAIARLYDADNKDNRTTAKLRGQRVAFAPSETPDDTVLGVASLTFGGDAPSGLGWGQVEPRFAPRVQEASAVVPAVAHLAGNAAPSRVIYGESYRKAGFEGNAGQVFLELPDKADLDFTKQSDRSGGLVAPSLKVTALSRLTGPISGTAETFASGTFEPAEFFKGIEGAKLFGAISLSELVPGPAPVDPKKIPTFVTQSLDAVGVLVGELERVRDQVGVLGNQGDAVKQQTQTLLDGIRDVIDPQAPDPANLASQAPSLTGAIRNLAGAIPASSLAQGDKRTLDALLQRAARQLDDWSTIEGLLTDFASGHQLPEVVTGHLEWKPEVKNWPNDTAPLFRLHTAPPTSLVLAVDLQAPTSKGHEPAVDVSCTLSEFDLCLLGSDPFLILHFERIEFLMRAGKKPDVEVTFGELEFAGCLEFVETLKEVIPLDGFSDPPSLEVSPQGIKASFSLALPNIGVGVFSLENISLGADLRVPFVGESIEVGFFFSTREDPFRVTVMMFGGGGFFGVTVTPDGVKLLEAAFEFGAEVSLNFGVASGSLSVMAGIYFRMEFQPDENASLTGYFRARGEVDVLGLISASIELYLELTYEFPTGKATGRATLTIEVEVLMFSATVEITCEKKFGGAKDPTFAQVMGVGLPGARPWDGYCQAFAKVA
jgi:hypothetical protein